MLILLFFLTLSSFPTANTSNRISSNYPKLRSSNSSSTSFEDAAIFHHASTNDYFNLHTLLVIMATATGKYPLKLSKNDLGLAV